MARVQIPFSVETHVKAAKPSSGELTVVQSVEGATVSGINRVTSASASFFTAESGGSAVGSPVTDANGNIPYWIEEGAWSITVSGGTPSIAPVTYPFDALSGRGVGKYAAGTVIAEALATNSVTTAKIENEAVTSGKVANTAITLAKLSSELQTTIGKLLTTTSGGARKINGGVFAPSVGFNSVSGRSGDTQTIPHGLGTTPVYALVSSAPIAISEFGGGLAAVGASIVSMDATNIHIIRTTFGTSNNGCNCYWLAVG